MYNYYACVIIDIIMVEDKVGTDSRAHLWAVFGGLCVVIVGLVVAIAVVSYHKTNDTELGSDSETEDSEEIQTYDPEVLKELEESEALVGGRFNEIKTESEELLKQDPIDADRINRLYNDGIAFASENGRTDYAMTLVLDRVQQLTDVGLKDKALEGTIAVDASVFSDPDKYRFYSIIVDLAEQTGNDEILQEYRPLQSSMKEAFDENANRIDEYRDERNNELPVELRSNYGDSEDQ